MKKYSLLIIALLLMVPMFVFAATEPRVLTVTPEAKGSTVLYTGTTEDGVTAVMCKLYAEDEEIDMLSSAVEDKKFEGSFEGVKAGKYTVSCAKYEGGEVVKADVTVEEVKDASVPPTIDPIHSSIIMLITFALVGVASVTYLKKRKSR